MVMGAFGPWINALGVGVSGLEGSNDGWIVLCAGLLGGLLFFGTHTSAYAGVWALMAGVIGSVTTIYDRHHISSVIAKGGPLASAVAHIGWGLNLAMLASISLTIGGIVWLRSAQAVDVTRHPAEI